MDWSLGFVIPVGLQEFRAETSIMKHVNVLLSGFRIHALEVRVCNSRWSAGVPGGDQHHEAAAPRQRCCCSALGFRV